MYFKVYVTEFFLFAWSNLHVVLVWKSKKNISLLICLHRVWDVYKRKSSLTVGYNTTKDGRLGIVGPWRQCRNASFTVSLFLSCFSCVVEENCIDENMTGNVECWQRKNWGMEKPRKQRYCIDVTIILSLVSNLGGFVSHRRSNSTFYTPQIQGRKRYREFFVWIFPTRRTWRCDQANKKKFCHLHFKAV